MYISKKKTTLGRRAFLRGAGGVALALPALDLMFGHHGEAFAGGGAIPKRYGVFFVGSVIGGNRGGAVGNPNALPDIAQTYIPATQGPGYELTPALLPFADYGVQDEINVITNLQIPNSDKGPGGTYHNDYPSPLLCGLATHGDDTGNAYHARGPSSDQIVREAIAGDAVFGDLIYDVQASNYGGKGPGISFRGGNPTTRAQKLQPQQSPRAAFNSLFLSFVPKDDPAAAARHAFAIEKKVAVLDRVMESASRLRDRLGVVDRRRLDEHLNEVSELSARIDSLPPSTTDTCYELPDPGADPEVGGNGSSGEGPTTFYDDGEGYSDEEGRARVFADLVHMAFACDLSRVTSFQFSHISSSMNVAPITDSGFVSSWHQLGHEEQFGPPAVAELLRWPYRHFAYLVAKLRDTPVGAGSLLDHCALALTHEGGASKTDYTGGSPHSLNRMACLLAGRAGGMTTGHHIDAAEAHTARVFVTAMRAVGVQQDLGSQSEPIPGLLPA